jgi:hypothetical protein
MSIISLSSGAEERSVAAGTSTVSISRKDSRTKLACCW